MKKFPVFIALVFLITGTFSFNSYSQEYRLLYDTTIATVTEIIDGDSIVVRTESGDIALVRILGINAAGFNDTLAYLNNILLGNRVTLIFGEGAPRHNGRWNIMNVYLRDGSSINEELLKRGLATLDEDFSTISDYKGLASKESFGKNNRLGMWSTDNISGVTIGMGVNINTATASQLRSYLEDVDTSLSLRIVKYRENNPFDNMFEIRFVDGFTREIFDKNRSLLSVSTNINSATQSEIATLDSVSASAARKIVEYRDQHILTNLSTLFDEDLMTFSMLRKNEPFMALTDQAEVYHAIPDDIVNINTASQRQLEEAGLTSTQAKNIIRYREEYSFKTFEEINNLPGFNLSKTKLNSLEDNLRVATDINTATLYELSSLFGEENNSEARKIIQNGPYGNILELTRYISGASYDAIKNYIFAGYHETSYLNINFATEDDLKNLGLSSSDANKVYQKRLKMHYSTNMPIDLWTYDAKISLYTNINKASIDELTRMHTDMTSSLVNAIVSLRDDQPFGTMDEVEDAFRNEGEAAIYNAIKNFIVLR